MWPAPFIALLIWGPWLLEGRQIRDKNGELVSSAGHHHHRPPHRPPRHRRRRHRGPGPLVHPQEPRTQPRRTGHRPLRGSHQAPRLREPPRMPRRHPQPRTHHEGQREGPGHDHRGPRGVHPHPCVGAEADTHAGCPAGTRGQRSGGLSRPIARRRPSRPDRPRAPPGPRGRKPWPRCPPPLSRAPTPESWALPGGPPHLRPGCRALGAWMAGQGAGSGVLSSTNAFSAPWCSSARAVAVPPSSWTRRRVRSKKSRPEGTRTDSSRSS